MNTLFKAILLFFGILSFITLVAIVFVKINNIDVYDIKLMMVNIILIASVSVFIPLCFVFNRNHQAHSNKNKYIRILEVILACIAIGISVLIICLIFSLFVLDDGYANKVFEDYALYSLNYCYISFAIY